MGNGVVPGIWFCRVDALALTGDGYHEFVRGAPSGDGIVHGLDGRVLGSVGGAVAMLSQFADRPGEQLLSYQENGLLQIWGDANAEDSALAKTRYANPIYRANQKLTAVDYNWPNLGGI